MWRLPAQNAQQRQAYEQYVSAAGPGGFSASLAWLEVLRQGLKHDVHCLAAWRGEQIVGVLPLALVRSLLFGRFLVSCPYLNSAGAVADDDAAATALIDRAVSLADELDVRYLELRHERAIQHSALTEKLATKAHMRLALPEKSEALWDRFKPKVRNQVRKGQEQGFAVQWGSVELLDEFYRVFSRNMRDLGTPVFGKRLFLSMLEQLGPAAELCVVRDGTQPIAAAVLVHGPEVTQVPSASSLRAYNSQNANMLMYWHLLQRAIERGQKVFDFGRSTIDSNTFKFKKQWGAEPHSAVWQYYVRRGGVGEMRPENSRYERYIRIWRRLPLAVTRLLGPVIVRGIP
jgi:FemAB-related protein (PEP-CTERM system-associated)